MNYKHGQYLSNAYTSWECMKQRCLNVKNKKYKNYGGRGITVCERWMEFKNFIEDMGDRPKFSSLERIDVNGNYCKENCKWSHSQEEQQNNRRDNKYFTYKSKTKKLKEWSRVTGINYSTLRSRIYTYNMTISDAIEIPIKRRKTLK